MVELGCPNRLKKMKADPSTIKQSQWDGDLTWDIAWRLTHAAVLLYNPRNCVPTARSRGPNTGGLEARRHGNAQDPRVQEITEDQWTWPSGQRRAEKGGEPRRITCGVDLHKGSARLGVADSLLDGNLIPGSLLNSIAQHALN